jgi:hypothetical protein
MIYSYVFKKINIKLFLKIEDLFESIFVNFQNILPFLIKSNPTVLPSVIVSKIEKNKNPTAPPPKNENNFFEMHRLFASTKIGLQKCFNKTR